MLKNIINLTKIFIKENEKKLNLIDKENNRLNTKSLMFWVLIILFIGIYYMSDEIIRYLIGIGKPEIFLNGYFLFLQILIIIQSIMLCTNIFYFSKDIENILYLPIKPIEILISKFSTLIFMLYKTELIFGLLPFLIYGIYTHMGTLFFINLIIGLTILPIFSTCIISIIMMFMMKTIKLFKNKDLMQTVISFILIFIIMIFANYAINYIFNNANTIEQQTEQIVNNINEKITEINKFTLVINPITKILQQKNIFKIILYFLELIFITLIGIFTFIGLGNKLYLKQLLKSKFYSKSKKDIKVDIKRKCKKNNIGISYVKKEFKLLVKNPLFFIQSIYPIILMTVMVSIIAIILIPQVAGILKMPEYKELAQDLKFNIEAVCIILGIVQIVGLFNYTSVTTISREGDNAFVMKYLPISFHKQIIYKSLPQIIINAISSGIILGVIAYQIPAISLKYIFIIFIFSIILSFINSLILVLVDLLMPKLKWDSEYEILKNNKNKLIQYVLIILNILFLVYINKVFKEYYLNTSLVAFGILLIAIFIIFNLIINKFKNKLFSKII